MSEPAVHVPVDDHDRSPGVPDTARTRRGVPWRTLPWKGAAVIAAAGIPVGLLWWLLAPSGLNLITRDPALGTGGNPQTWLPRDLVLAGLFLLAGCLSGVFAAGKRPDRLGTTTIVLAVVAGAAGALLAWGTGVLAGTSWGAAEDTSASASIAFSLRSYAVLLLWPAATALGIFAAAIFSRPGAEPGLETDPLQRP